MTSSSWSCFLSSVSFLSLSFSFLTVSFFLGLTAGLGISSLSSISSTSPISATSSIAAIFSSGSSSSSVPFSSLKISPLAPLKKAVKSISLSVLSIIAIFFSVSLSVSWVEDSGLGIIIISSSPPPSSSVCFALFFSCGGCCCRKGFCDFIFCPCFMFLFWNWLLVFLGIEILYRVLFLNGCFTFNLSSRELIIYYLIIIKLCIYIKLHIIDYM